MVPALIFPFKFAILFNKVAFHFRMIFPQNCEIRSLVIRPREKIKNCETHGRIVRVGRSVKM